MVWKVIKRCGEGFPSGNPGRCSRQVVWGRGKAPRGMMLAPRPVIIPLIEYLKHKGRPGLDTVLHGLQSGHLLKSVSKFRGHWRFWETGGGKNARGWGGGDRDGGIFFFSYCMKVLRLEKTFLREHLGNLGGSIGSSTKSFTSCILTVSNSLRGFKLFEYLKLPMPLTAERL